MSQHITVADYNPLWIKKYEEEAVLIKEILADNCIAIYHIGSTAVPGLAAKPIIDIAVGVRNVADILLQREELARHGIIYRGEDVKSQLLFVLGDFFARYENSSYSCS